MSLAIGTSSNQGRLLNLTLVALSCLFLLSAEPVRGQIQDRPKAGSEQKKLEALAGEWTYEGSLSDTPLGPGGKFAGKSTSRMILDGLFLESRSEDTGLYGGKEMAYKSVSITWFDPTTKTYLAQSFDNDGMVSRSTESVSGNTWTDTGTATDTKGRTYRFRSSTTLSPDGRSSAEKGEISFDDGKTWKPSYELTRKKIGG